MKVGILGSGDVGRALAHGFLSEKHEVMIGTRHPDKLSGWLAKEGKGAKTGSFSETASYGELLVLAVKGLAAEEVLSSLAEKDISGKVIVDTTNPIADAPPVNGVLRFFTSLDKSLLEKLQAAVPSAKLVKAFNSIGSAHMYKPAFAGKPTMFLCGNDEGARKTVADIVAAFGFTPEDMGKAEAARAIEPLCMLWCIPGLQRNDWSHAFAMLRA